MKARNPVHPSGDSKHHLLLITQPDDCILIAVAISYRSTGTSEKGNWDLVESHVQRFGRDADATSALLVSPGRSSYLGFALHPEVEA